LECTGRHCRHGRWRGSFASSPGACRWCDENDVDGAARNRKAMKWSDPRSADVASDATGFLVAPLVLTTDAVGASKEGAARDIPLDALLVTEATVLAVDVCLLTKFLVLRRRPNGADDERTHTRWRSRARRIRIVEGASKRTDCGSEGSPRLARCPQAAAFPHEPDQVVPVHVRLGCTTRTRHRRVARGACLRSPPPTDDPCAM
jgi:hypothetical protein